MYLTGQRNGISNLANLLYYLTSCCTLHKPVLHLFFELRVILCQVALQDLFVASTTAEDCRVSSEHFSLCRVVFGGLIHTTESVATGNTCGRGRSSGPDECGDATSLRR